MIGSSWNYVMAHNTAKGAVLWRKAMLDKVWSLRIHGGVVVAVDFNDVVVLDITSGHHIYAMPPVGDDVNGICVFDGLTDEPLSLSIPCIDFQLHCLSLH